MTLALLSTKLYIPPQRADSVPRPRLVEKLHSAANSPRSFVLLSGPAGSGKTTLLSQFVAGLDRPVAWLSLDKADDDPARFWKYVIAACRSVLAGIGQSSLALLDGSQALPDDTIPTLLINDLAEQERALVLILDDFHVIQEPSINASFSFLLDHLPANLHIVISTRADPPWPMARYRVRNRLVEIRARDLRFSPEEAAEFLNQVMGFALPAEEVAALEARTEGWIAGLQLAAIAMQSSQPGSDTTAFVQAFAGSHLYISEYLIEEVLQRYPEDVQTFLLQTSILDRLNARLCNAVTERLDGQAMLVTLQRANLFIIPLDGEGQWFRYHHLFADLLRSRLPLASTAPAISELHSRASVWYAENGFSLEAVNHALAANDFERAAELVKRFAPSLIFSGQLNTLRDWLEALPPLSFRAYPQLDFYLFWIDILQARADLSERVIQKKEALLDELPSTPENDRLRGELMAVVCRALALSGRTSEGIRLAQEALAYLPPDTLAARARALSALATAHDLEGRRDEALPAYRESFSQAVAAGDYRLAAHTMLVKGLVQITYGRLHEATKTFQTIIDMATAAPAAADSARNISSNEVFFPAGQGYIGLGSIYLEWNDLAAAENYLEQGLDLCRRGGLDGIFVGKVQMSRLRQAEADLAGALAELQGLQQAQRVDGFNLVARQIQIALAEANVAEAGRLAAPLTGLLNGDPDSTGIPLLFFEMLETIIARVFLAQGESELALQLLDRLQASAGPGERAGRLIEVHLLRALVHTKQHDGHLSPQAIKSFERALALGEQANYVLLFLEEGRNVIGLLNAVIQRSTISAQTKNYARKLLAEFNKIGEAAEFPGEAGDLVEPLTPREMEVLQLIAAGDSNKAIAGKLFITVRTVKKHASNIYGKLNVSRRTEAVARARELGLLPYNR